MFVYMCLTFTHLFIDLLEFLVFFYPGPPPPRDGPDGPDGMDGTDGRWGDRGGPKAPPEKKQTNCLSRRFFEFEPTVKQLYATDLRPT